MPTPRLASEGFQTAVSSMLDGRLMVDGTFFTSPDRIRHAAESAPDGYELHVPATLSRLLAEGDLQELGDVLAWLNDDRDLHHEDLEVLLGEAAPLAEAWQPAQATQEALDRLRETTGRPWELDDPRRRILAETYTFLYESSGAWAHTRRTPRELWQQGVAVLDRGKEFRVRLKQTTGGQASRTFLAVLLPMDNLVAEVSSEARVLLTAAEEVVLVLDP